jgi:hypothetical protein
MNSVPERNVGVNDAERYLAYLANKSFLSLWSYPNVYRSPGKELADLLVVCGNDVFIFQDKWSEFPTTTSIEIGWQRWFKNTVFGGAKQVWGAQRYLQNVSSQLYLDPSCKTPFPLPIPEPGLANFHLIVVTHGGSKSCRKHFQGGSGSFILSTDIIGVENHSDPFTIGELDPLKSFVHVLDDTSLGILMDTLDTISDFKKYLSKRALLLRSGMNVISTGEEELLTNYLKNIDPEENEHNFNLSNGKIGEFDSVVLAEGSWLEFQENPQRLAQIEQDKVSYFWDYLIERFSHHAIQGTQYAHPDSETNPNLADTEKTLRFMALEPRYVRRALSKSLLEMVEITSPKQRRLRIAESHSTPGLRYVFLLFPMPPAENDHSHDDYRGMRATYLEGCCLVTKLKYPDTLHIVGIATESGTGNGGRSEDAMYFDATQWNPDIEKAAIEFHNEFEVLVNPTAIKVSVKEYPDVVSKEEFLKNPRNKMCPCGSEEKYKKCCLKKGRKFYQ